MTAQEIEELIPVLKKLRQLGLTKFEHHGGVFEFNSDVVAVPVNLEELPQRYRSDEEEAEIARRYIERKQEEANADLFAAV